MPNRFVMFPAGNLAEAKTYKEWGDARFRALSGEEDGILGQLMTDTQGRHVTTYFGPPFVWTDEVAEPEDGPTMRAAGEIVENWERLEADDDE